jgi:hypothetical protein
VLTSLNFQFDDNEPNPNAYETHVHDITHDIDTSIDDIMGHYSVNVTIVPPSKMHEHCHVEILSDSDQKSWDNVTEDGNPRFDHNVQRAARSCSGPLHNDNVALNSRIQCGT